MTICIYLNARKRLGFYMLSIFSCILPFVSIFQDAAGVANVSGNKEQKENVNAQLVWFISFDPGYESWINKEIDKKTKEKNLYK